MTGKIRSLAGLAVLLTAIAASGQTSLRVTVPFSFVAGRTSSPAGDYRVLLNEEQNILTLISDSSKPITVLTVNALPSSNGRCYLRFHHYGEHWFLERVAINSVARELPIDKRVKEVFTASTLGSGGPVSSDVAVH